MKLIKLIIALFAATKTPKRLAEKSNDVLNVFTSTVERLRIVNTEISDEVTRREEVIKANEADKAALLGTLQANENLISKIDTFLQ